MGSPPKIRIDKWLWAARFFKTRALASKAVRGGKVRCNGERVKPAHPVQIGHLLHIQQGYDNRTVRVQQLSGRRGPAKEAEQLYHETEESIRQREQDAARRRTAASVRPRGQGRPAKRERRHIIRFTRAGE